MTNEKNIERLFRQHHEKMYNMARCILSDDDESKDVVNDVFAQIIADDMVLLPGSEEGYLMRSVRNRCLNIIAHKSVREKVARLLTDDADVTLSEDTDERLDQLLLLINNLEPPIRKHIFRLRYLQDKSYQEVADEVGVSKVTVFAHLSKAKDWIRKHLASVVGIVFLSGVALAAVHNGWLRFAASDKAMGNKAATEHTARPTPVANDSIKAMTAGGKDSLDMKPVVFDDAELGTILTQMADFYHVRVEYDNASTRHVRLFFNWDKTKTLEQNLDILNAFDRIQIECAEGTLRVK